MPLYGLFSLKAKCASNGVASDDVESKAVKCSDRIFCFEKDLSQWLDDRKFVTIALKLITEHNVTLPYKYKFSEEGELQISYSKKSVTVSHPANFPNSQINGLSNIREFLSRNNSGDMAKRFNDPDDIIRRHQLLCYDERTAAFLLGICAPVPFSANYNFLYTSNGTAEKACEFSGTYWMLLSRNGAAQKSEEFVLLPRKLHCHTYDKFLTYLDNILCRFCLVFNILNIANNRESSRFKKLPNFICILERKLRRISQEQRVVLLEEFGLIIDTHAGPQ
ncbi:hypothetical protein DdX_15641 [Ditylenchus destructor]|uniref:Uncharacterized protein n=1 Tax=Ditylenchus destructor TaxID=166010 RepID=A0AAD4MQF3_9BILA|nr:hypothetical protein DdX_15641 [Ditylenchus destructor]